LIVKSLLGDVTELKRDFDDLAKVHARCDLSRWVMEIQICLKLRLHEVLHRFEIVLIEGLSDEVEHEKALLVRD